MKYVKSLGLAAVAAMALTAFAGAGTASATVLCKTNLTSGCAAAGWDYTGSFGASLTSSAVLETLGGTTIDTCTRGSAGGFWSTGGTNATETPTSAIIELTWGTAENPCTKTTDSVDNASGPTFGELEIHYIAGTDNGTLTGRGSKVTISTIFGICVYGTGEGTDLGTLVGGTPMTISINTVIKKIEGKETCPAEARWTANYSITSPGTLFVASS